MRGSKLITAALAVAIVGAGVTAAEVVTPGIAQAHTGDLHASYVCQTDGQYKVTYTLDITQTNLVGSTLWGIGTTNFQGTPSSATNPITLNNGPVPSTGAGTITLGTQLLPGTTTAGPWVYAFTTWSDNYKKGSDGRVDQFTVPCKIHVTATATLTPPTCLAAGSVVKSSGPGYTWAETGPDSAKVYTATATAGYTLDGTKVFGPWNLVQLSPTAESCLIPVTPTYNTAPPTCSVGGTVTPVQATGVVWTLNQNGSYTASAASGYKLTAPVTTPVPAPKLTGEQCIVHITPTASYTPPTCTTPGSVTLGQNVGYTWTNNGAAEPTGKIYTAVATQGYALDGTKDFGPWRITQLTQFDTLACRVPVTPAYTTTPPTCAVAGTVVPTVTNGVVWTLNQNGSYTASAAAGFVLTAELTTPVPIAQLTGEQCTVPSNPKATITTECGSYDIELTNDVSPPQGFTAPAVTFIVTIDGAITEHIVQPQASSLTSTAVHLTGSFDEDSGDHAISVSIKGSEATPVTATVKTDCELNDVHPSLTAVPPTCLAEGSVTLGEAIGFHWLQNENGTFTAVANEGFKIVGTTTFGPFPIARLIGRTCEDPINFKAVTVACGAITFSNVGTPAAGQFGVAAVFVTNPEFADGPVTVPFGESTTRNLPEDATDTNKVVQIVVDGTSYSVPTDCVKATIEVLPPTQPAPAPVPPTTAETAPIVPPSGGLPVTGSSPWTTLLIALAALGAGGLVVRLSRRSTS